MRFVYLLPAIRLARVGVSFVLTFAFTSFLFCCSASPFWRYTAVITYSRVVITLFSRITSLWISGYKLLSKYYASRSYLVYSGISLPVIRYIQLSLERINLSSIYYYSYTYRAVGSCGILSDNRYRKPFKEENLR